MTSLNLVYTGSGNGMLSDSTKPLPELMWLIICEVTSLMWHLPEGNLTGNAQDIYICDTTLKIMNFKLTHWGLVTPFAWRHQAITWTNVDLSSVKFNGIHLKAIS